MQKPRQTQAETEGCAMRLRVYLSSSQESLAGSWLYVSHRFRNEAVLFLKNRRQACGKWLRENPGIAKKERPAELFDDAIQACSAWLTTRLQQARSNAQFDLAVSSSKNDLVRAVSDAWRHLSTGERELAQDAWLLRVPRTVLDQVIQDLKKTTAKAIKDRSGHGRGKATRVAGFPGYHKWRYPGSVRFQVVASKNEAFRAHWQDDKLFIPGLGPVKYRDSGYSLPATPAKMMTLARDAADQWHVSFFCVSTKDVQAEHTTTVAATALPKGPTGQFPACEGIDAGLTDRATSSCHGKSGRGRFLKRYERKFRRKGKSLSRKQKGSRRWKKARRELGKLHIQVARAREIEVRHLCQEIVRRSAIVCVEDLNLAFMLRNRFLSQSAHDAALGMFYRLLQEECDKRGHLLLRAPRFSATTQTCPTPGCGYVNKALKNDLSCRKWQCPQCHRSHDRDIAAAQNTQIFALKAEINRISSVTGSENDPGMPKLHPELEAFVLRGGLTALLEDLLSSERRKGSSLGLPESTKRASTRAPAFRMERKAGG